MSEPGLTLSVVIPMFNEEAVIPLLVQRLRPALDGVGEPYEVVAVDDGSRDATYAVLQGVRRTWPQLRIVRLRRNSGHQAALNAGLMSARGAYVASIDADLQDPPEKIPEMLELARTQGLDIVYGVRSDRGTDTRFKRWTAGAYYRLMRRMVGRNVPSQGGDFRLLSRTTVEALRELPERAPVLRLLVPWIGFPSGQVSYVREERAAGSTKYPLRKMIMLAVDSITNFSAAPLRLATWLGVSGMAISAVLVVMGLIAYARGTVVPGWSSLFLAVLLLGAIQLLCLGLLGEYVGRLYTAVQNRPAYFIASDTESSPARVPASRTAVEDSLGERVTL
ncbi:glycosyltransferase family 2 protein [Actinoplanes teichomyceticus]|uniref:Dolichol-phosphate mannosyltransferase n=1 Tax=Actinoplanes teichomyceticus TaxID=1867 RepID=A0A561WP84_ACTTI|nr:glycosyltransferase family 2 protein [Actinoplanes teichomyceticus]TWG25671.1 dolichol-phosphate mannosyltransferase [Actinoplanes teichomyceticus]GIF10744.1 glucosyl transferase [Actinoplanes teichomyceticus]